MPEITGADSLFEANGILAQSEENTAMLYQTGTTCFLAGGSTLGLQTMLACTCSPGDTVIAARNAHKAFIRRLRAARFARAVDSARLQGQFRRERDGCARTGGSGAFEKAGQRRCMLPRRTIWDI